MLAREYRIGPTVRGAFALHDAFCRPFAPARINADVVLAPIDLRLDHLIQNLHRQVNAFEAAKNTLPSPDMIELGQEQKARRLPPLPSPVIFLFDHVVAHLRENHDGPLHAAARRFDPFLEPIENIPGGKLNVGQRAFLENVWRPRVRPQLVAAGFWKAANLGM
jgi:hypothetical protein